MSKMWTGLQLQLLTQKSKAQQPERIGSLLLRKKENILNRKLMIKRKLTPLKIFYKLITKQEALIFATIAEKSSMWAKRYLAYSSIAVTLFALNASQFFTITIGFAVQFAGNSLSKLKAWTNYL